MHRTKLANTPFAIIVNAMRSASILVLPTFFAFVLCVAAQDNPPPPSQPAETPAQLQSPASKPAAGISDLSATSSAQRLATLPNRYLFLLTESMQRFQSRDFKGAIDYIERADEILPPTAWSLNIRGAVAIEQRDFDRGYKLCSDALKLDPGFFPAKFNICEIPFLQGNYREARGMWLKLFATVKPGDLVAELLIYRIYLTYLLENNLPLAREWMEKIPFPSQTPAYQYANATWARHHGQIAKWDEWIQSAAYIWPESKRSEYMDVLIQLGWMKRE